MRVRFEMFEHGIGSGMIAECDLSEKDAKSRFEKLKKNAKCGWAELVAEDDDEGGYMEILETHDNIKLAQMISSIC